jgi:serine/threonine protein kinase/WD40 repeat protein
MDSPVVNQIKGYELRERIGAGGFGAVYRAFQSTVGREVAIKFILPGFSSQPDFIRRFETEAQLVARLEHPHITPLYDYWRDPDGAYLVMRWLRGGSLREALQNGPFDLRSAALLLDQIAGALSLAHRNGVIHRDLKPGNILLDEDGNAYLADFGIAKDLNFQSGHTQPDAIIGSLDYISPEQARSEPVTPRTDIYSLGVVLYEMLAGQHPFHNVSAIERLYKHINDPLPELTGLDAGVEDAVNRVIQKATAKNPDHRYADALTMAADFREAAGLNRTPASGQMVEALLTPREHEILRLIIDGRSNKEIAQQLTVTVGTVKWYVNQIFSKLHVRSRVQAIIRARELHLIGGTAEYQAGQASSSLYNLPEAENPYKGLRAFQAADEQDFFGREEVVAKLVKRMGEVSPSGAVREPPLQSSSDPNFARFLAVIGPSGSGKSSLVKAGLIPALWRGELPGSEKWFVVEMLPGSHPLDKLEVALMKVAANQASGLNEQLRRDGRGLLRASDLILPDDGSELVLVIDQFEEVFTLVEDETERAHFLDLLMTAVKDPRSRVRVVITLRADFYDRPLHYPEFGEFVRSQMETILPLSVKGLERAIAGPAERVGVKFEAGLVAAMVAEMNYQAGALPLLQYALTELFERREGRLLTHKAYQEIGGSVGALAKRAEELYLDLSPEGQEAARQMFMRLVTLGEGVEDTRRRTTRSELLAIANGVGAIRESPLQLDPDIIDDLIDTYANYRLLSLDNDPATRAPTVELGHEAILREWERLRRWLNDSREDIRLQRQLATLTGDWEKSRQDASFLLRGARLETFEKWAAQTGLALTPDERTYLQASLTQREQEHAAEEERQLRVTALEKRSVRFLRALVAVLLLATLGAFGLTGVAVTNANEAEQNSLYARSIALASAAKSAQLSNSPDQAITLALAANTMTDNPPAFAQSVLYQTAFVPATRRIFSASSHVVGVAINPDGHSLLTWSGDSAALTLWDISTGQIIREIPELMPGRVMGADIMFAPEGKTFFAALFTPQNSAVTIAEFDIATGQKIMEFALPDTDSFPVPPLTLSSDGQMLLTSSGSVSTGDIVEGPMYAWNVATGQVIRQFEEPNLERPYVTKDLRISPDNQQALMGYQNGSVVLWDVNAGKALHTFEGLIGEAIGTFFTTEGIVTVTTDYLDKYTTTVTLWDPKTGESLRQQIWTTAVIDADLSPDNHTIALGFVAPYITVFDLKIWKSTHELYGHGTAVSTLDFTPDGHGLASAFFDGDPDPRLWNLDNGSEIIRMEGLTSFLSSFILSPDGRTALSQQYNGPLTLWDIKTGKTIRQLGETHSSFIGTAFSPDGRYIVSGTSSEGPCPALDSKLTLTDVATGKIVWQVDTEGSYAITGKVFINDGSQIATVDRVCGGDITIWDAATGQLVTRWSGHKDTVWDITASPDGRMAATASNDARAIIWDPATGSILHTLQHENGVSRVIFSPDSHQLLAADITGILHLWDTASGQELQQFIGAARIIFMQFSPDGRYIVDSSSDNNVYVWDLHTGEVVRQFSFPTISPLGSAVAFSPDGKSLFMTDENNIIHQVDLMLAPGELLNWIAANRYVRDLTCAERKLYRVEPPCSDSNAKS